MPEPEIDFLACYDEAIAQKIVDFIVNLKLTNEVAYVNTVAALAGNLASNSNADSRSDILDETVIFMLDYIERARTLGGKYLSNPQ